MILSLFFFYDIFSKNKNKKVLLTNLIFVRGLGRELGWVGGGGLGNDKESYCPQYRSVHQLNQSHGAVTQPWSPRSNQCNRSRGQDQKDLCVYCVDRWT